MAKLLWVSWKGMNKMFDSARRHRAYRGGLCLALTAAIIVVMGSAGLAQKKCTPGVGNIGDSGDGLYIAPTTIFQSPDTNMAVAMETEAPGLAVTSAATNGSPFFELTRGGGTIAPASGQFTYQIDLCSLSQVAGGLQFPVSLWYGSKSVHEWAANWPEWIRPFGEHWHGTWDDCLLDPVPGQVVARVCKFGLWVEADVADWRIVQCEQENSKQPGTKIIAPFTEYTYHPFADGSRLVYQ